MKCRHSGLGLPPLAGMLLAQLVSAAPLPNAWQITDSLATGGALNYATNLFVRHAWQPRSGAESGDAGLDRDHRSGNIGWRRSASGARRLDSSGRMASMKLQHVIL